ncbi:hypothetical protein N7513_003388 [Penicillium frequentans]|uniref:Uncharacterized protein n=1 Tax=Penicillium frequentans TaxID=3151616 RepID=A0AAD6CXA5_9EURO|nr:hypothetical protein N7494_005080 [Penicillium glabrum]KAJ5557802.1 hypothetical protein N7513_003388 [Penicillium glabrum]
MSIRDIAKKQGGSAIGVENGTTNHVTPKNHQEYEPSSEKNDSNLTADKAGIQSFEVSHKTFEVSLQSILDGSFQPSKDLHDLDNEFMAYMYRKLLDAEPYESHMTLHALNILRQDGRIPGPSRHGIKMFLKYSSETMAISWKVYKDFKHALASQNVLQDKQYLPDAASLTIHECPGCFTWLIQSRAIPASGFNSAGQSFFRLAFYEDRVDIARELLLAMSAEHILEPASIMADCRQQTVLEMSVMEAELFNICWTKIESNPNLDLSNVLGPRYSAHVCRHATPDLAVRMLARKIDLANIVKAFPLVAWPEMAQYHPSPASLFNWLVQRGCWPYSTEASPDTPLLAAAQYDRFEATNWLLWNNHNAWEQWKCAINAAERQTESSAHILDLFLTCISLAVPPHPLRWPQDVTCKVIEAACDQSQLSRAENLRITQDLAIQKLRCVTAAAPHPVVYTKESLLIAKRAGLTDLVNFLRAGNKEALRTLEDSC